MKNLNDRLYAVINTRPTFTADDITDGGRIAVDPDHRANGRQSAIGAVIRTWHQQGLIEPTGDVVRSTARHRKGGLIRVWKATAKGQYRAAYPRGSGFDR